MKRLITTTFAMLFSLIVFSQHMIVVDGQVSNNGGNSIMVILDFNDSLYRYIDTVYTDTSGYYIDTVIVTLSGPAAVGYLTASITDCNSNVKYSTATYSINISALTLNLNYCGSNPPATCKAAFSRTQARDTSGNLVPGHVLITDMSTGSNLQYLWDFGDSSTSTLKNPVHTYTGNGPYNLCLTVTDSNCSDTYCDSLTVDSNGMVLLGTVGFTIHVGGFFMGLQDISDVEFDVYPNPVDQVLNVQFKARRKENVELNVINLQGQLEKSEKLTVSGNELYKLDVSNLNSGVYMLYLQSESGYFSKRFIKK